MKMIIAIIRPDKFEAVQAALVAKVGGYVVETLNSGRRQYLLVRNKDEAYARAQTEPAGVIIRQVNLEDLFLKVTGRGLNEMQ